MPEAERAFVLICQGLFKIAALAGFFGAIGKQVRDISGDVEDCKQVVLQTHHENTTQGQLGLCRSHWLIKKHRTFCFYAVFSLKAVK